MVKIQYCEENEKSTDFLKSFYNFTGDKFSLLITCKTKIRALFSVKEKTFTLNVKYTIWYM